MIEDSALMAQVRGLDARTLGRVVRHVGLEDAGEIVALATTDQLRDMFDEDLWVSPEAGQEEKFDAGRFALWLEIMLESGERYVANKLMELPVELVTLGLQRQVFVLDIDELAMEMSERSRGVDLVEKALESCQYEEIDQYRVIGRRLEHWDAIIAVLLELDRNHSSYLRRVLELCCAASTEYIEDNGGLYEVLSAEDVIEGDAATEREERRASAGYVMPTDAAAFLALPRVNTLDEVVASRKRDPVTAAYFRSIAPIAKRPAPMPNLGDMDQMRFAALLEETGVTEPLKPSLPPDKASGQDAGGPSASGPHPSGPSSHATGVPMFQRILETLRDEEPLLYAKRTEELAYLANVLVVGSTFAGRAFRPVEAAEAAICTCNIGLDLLLEVSQGLVSVVGREASADHLFRIGWHVLFHEVSMTAVKSLERRLRLREAPAKILTVVRTALAEQKPWLARPKLRVRGDWLSPAERDIFESLLDRFPTLPPIKSGDVSAQPPVDGTSPFFARLADIDVAHTMLDSE